MFIVTKEGSSRRPVGYGASEACHYLRKSEVTSKRSGSWSTAAPLRPQPAGAHSGGRRAHSRAPQGEERLESSTIRHVLPDETMDGRRTLTLAHGARAHYAAEPFGSTLVMPAAEERIVSCRSASVGQVRPRQIDYHPLQAEVDQAHPRMTGTA